MARGWNFRYQTHLETYNNKLLAILQCAIYPPINRLPPPLLQFLVCSRKAMTSHERARGFRSSERRRVRARDHGVLRRPLAVVVVFLEHGLRFHGGRFSPEEKHHSCSISIGVSASSGVASPFDHRFDHPVRELLPSPLGVTRRLPPPHG